MGIVKKMTKGVNSFTFHQLKDKRKAENNVQYFAVDSERKVIVSFFLWVLRNRCYRKL